MAGTSKVTEGRRSTRHRQSVDYKGTVAPGTPNWLKLSNKQQINETDQQGVNKENDRPAPAATKKGRASKVAPILQKDSSDKSSAKDRAEAEAKDSQEDGKHTGKATNVAAQSKAEKKLQKAEDAAVVTTTRTSKQLPKQRRSAPTTKHEQAGDADKARLALAKPAGKRSLPEDRTEAPGGSKKAKTSQHEQTAGEAAQVAPTEGKAAKGAKPAGKGSKSTASWSSGEDMHPDAEAHPPHEPANAKATRERPAKQDVPARKPEAPPQLPAKGQEPMKGGSSGSSEDKAAGEAAAKGKVPAPVEQDAVLADDSGASASSDFQKLQAEYAVLQKKYRAIKQQRMEELEALMTEQQQRALEHREAALKLAEHWKEEAIKQAKFAQEAGSAQLQKQRKALQEENRKLQQQLLDAQAAVLQQQATVTDLQHLLAMAERRAVTPVKSQVTPRIGTNAASPLGIQSQMGASNTPTCISAIRDAYKSCTRAPTNSARPVPTHTPVHLQEAHAMCPEGNDLSETYRKPAHILGATAGPTDAAPSPAGSVGLQGHMIAGSPLVQYSENASVYQPRSRFAAEAAVPAHQEQEAEQAGAEALPALDHVGVKPVVAALPEQGDPAEAAGRLRAEKGASAPAVMTTHSWPELVREVQQLPGPVGEAAKEMLQEGSMAGGQGSTMTQKALDTLVGLRAESAGQGGYKYTHRSTGYTFEIRPSEGDATPESEVLMPGQRELLFIPLDLGMAAQVLPDYLKEDITFIATHKQKLVGRIMEALGTLSIRQSRAGQ